MLKKALTAVFCALILVSIIAIPVSACTIFAAVDGNLVLAGNNEDWSDLNTHMWFVPPTEEKHGWVYFGFGDGYPQGGMNDQGLFYDWAAFPARSDVVFPTDKPTYQGIIEQKIMEECATVEEAVDLLNGYNYREFSRSHIMLVDRTGTSAIVEWGKDELVAIYRDQGVGYQVMSNFTVSDPSLAGWYPCRRFSTAERELRTLTRDSAVSVDAFRSILDMVHQPSSSSSETVYSNVYDLTNGVVYVYYRHDFDRVVTVDLEEELEKGAHSYALKSLFADIEPATATPAAMVAVESRQPVAVATAEPHSNPTAAPDAVVTESRQERHNSWQVWLVVPIGSLVVALIVWQVLGRWRARR
jgi:hypothetical protein